MKRSSKRNASNLLTAMVAAAFLKVPAAPQEVQPPGFDELVQQFNTDNGIVSEVVDTEIGINNYAKSKTQFDGVTNEMQVTYLQLNPDQGVELPILSTGVKDENIDFTVMMWFKVDEAFYTKSAPGGEAPQIMYLFSFEDSVACFLTDTLTLMCDSWDRRKLQIPSGKLTPGIWYHLTLMSSADQESFLLVQSNDEVIASDTQGSFGFRQSTMYNWKTCIGDCASNFGFFGGIREVVLLARTITQQEASRAKNMVFTYDNAIKAYFRFQDIQNKFEKDEFVDWPWTAFKNEPTSRNSFIGIDIIPNDVCPSVLDQITTLKLGKKSSISTIELDTKMLQTQYAYTVSMTVQVNETSCTALDPVEAEKDCNLLELEGSFMLFLVGRNTGRFFFFANKNYYESMSTAFFIPYDQWVTIQMTLEHFNGYTIVVSDQNGKAFFRTRVVTNMREQWPSNKLKLFTSFDGYVEHFYFDNEAVKLSPYHALNLRDDKKALINVLFTESNLKSASKLRNSGKLGSTVTIKGDVDNLFEDVFFQMPAEGLIGGTIEDTSTIFDGIACNDKHMTTKLVGPDSFIQFFTPSLQDWSSQNTVEFWFKIEDPSGYQKDQLLFSMVSNNENPQDYYRIFIQNGELKCAPFGTRSYKDPVITFSQFKFENQDTYGWWHVSCSYAYQQSAKGSLFNSKLSQTFEETMVGLPKFYPANSLIAAFGKSTVAEDSAMLPGATNILIKEFRFWNKQLSSIEVDINRYRQIDPSKLPADYLLVYLRMATGSSTIDNFAARNPYYRFDSIQLEQNQLAFIEDFIETDKYSYDRKLDLVVAQKIRTYHTVCPVHTYYMKQYCYNEPVNQAVLAIFPQWDSEASELNWELTLINSSVINSDVIQFLVDRWNTDDDIVNAFLEDKNKNGSLGHVLPSSLLRHESEYSVFAQLTNDETTFSKSVSSKFIPSKCKWMTVVDEGVNEGYQVFRVSPGTEDIKFSLQLERNPTLDCSSFDFFNSFNGLDFDFLMTDTAEYISYLPQMEVSVFDPETQEPVQEGKVVPTRLMIDIVMPAAEQEKLPVFQDIMIMITVNWTNAGYAQIELDDNIVFQNLLYTVKFEPVANVLFADLVASQTEIIKGETLILDASSSYISNMPESLQRRSLAYDWSCPGFLITFCASMSGDQLSIPFAEIEKTDIIYEELYTFDVTVVWAKPDGTTESQTLSQEVTFWNLEIPEFVIDFEEMQTLITAQQNSLFYLQTLNFAIDDIYDYEVVWNLEPELSNPDNRAVLSGGRVMQILQGTYSKNTLYTVTLTVSHKELDKLTSVKEVSFQTLAPPVGGTVQVNPFQGYIGDEFTVSLADWTSANLPIEYNVYSTFDQQGNRKGLLLNEDGPIPIDEEFKFNAERSTPIIVSVFDASGETLEFPLNIEITVRPDPVELDPEKDDPDAVDEGDDSTTPENNEGEPDDATPEADKNGEETPSGDDVAPADDNAEDGTDDALEDSSIDISPQNLLMQIRGTQSMFQRVNYMLIAVETATTPGFTNKVDVGEQIAFRKELLDEMEKEIIVFVATAGNDPLYMSTRDFLIENFQMLEQLTQPSEYMDQDLVDKSAQVIHRLMLFEEFDLVLEAESGAFRANYFATLENLNKFGSVNNVERVLEWVRVQLEKKINAMCRFSSTPNPYEYRSQVGEFGFSLFQFDQQTALKSKRGTMQALGATYGYNSYTMYNWFNNMPGTLCAQVYSQNYGKVDMKGAYKPNSKGRLQASVYELGTDTRFQMSQLSGQTIATFDIDRASYYSNQTVCMGQSKTSGLWTGDLCKSELSVEDVTMKCICNAFDSTHIALYSDFTRTLGEPVVFPAIQLPEDTKYAVVPSKIDLNGINGKVTDDVVSQIKDVNGTNYVWMGQTILVAILTLAGSLFTRKMDMKDEADQCLTRTSPIPVTKQNHFIEEVAKELGESYASVCFRKQSLFYYRTIYTKTAFPHLMSQMHPLVSPFTSYSATQKRFLRFMIYILQVNIISMVIFLFFSQVYRQNDRGRDVDVLDQSDILNVLLATGLFSILLTPWLSEPLIKACSNQLVQSNSPTNEFVATPYILKQRREPMKIVLIVTSICLTVALPIWAITTSNTIPASNQYCMSTTLIGSLFGSTLCTNLIYLWINSCMARKAAYAPNKKKAATCVTFAHYRALQIVRDMKAVNEIKDQFTLADVHPSSLESVDGMGSHHSGASCNHMSSQHNSRRHVSSHHSSLANSCNNIKFPPLHRDQTISDDQQNNSNSPEVIDELQQCVVGQSLPGKQQFTEDDEHAASGVCSLGIQGDGDESNRHPHLAAYEAQNEDSQKHLIASMLKDSMIDLNNSRNDVVPQRTQIDDDVYAPVVPEGHQANAADQDSSSISSSQMVSPNKKICLKGNGEKKPHEDDEAVAIASPNRRSHANKGTVFQKSAPQIIRQ